VGMFSWHTLGPLIGHRLNATAFGIGIFLCLSPMECLGKFRQLLDFLLRPKSRPTHWWSKKQDGHFNELV